IAQQTETIQFASSCVVLTKKHECVLAGRLNNCDFVIRKPARRSSNILREKIWELREESATNIFRILYAFYPDRRIILLHCFMKKTQKTPRKEIETAQKRFQEFLARKGNMDNE